MKIVKVISQIFRPNPIADKTVIDAIPHYDPNNATLKEFQNYVRSLAKNDTNKTFYEPKRLVTEEERKEMAQFRKRVRYLAENNVNLTFIC